MKALSAGKIKARAIDVLFACARGAKRLDPYQNNTGTLPTDSAHIQLSFLYKDVKALEGRMSIKFDEQRKSASFDLFPLRASKQSNENSSCRKSPIVRWFIPFYSTVMTTFPTACPASRYRIASATSRNGKRLSMTGVTLSASSSSFITIKSFWLGFISTFPIF